MPDAVDLIEIRLDRFDDPATTDLQTLRTALARPAILTLRRTAEGGEFAGTAEERVAILTRADAAGFDWVDVEADVADSVPRRGSRRIVSWHGETDGSDGAARARSLFDRDADVLKVAANAPDAAAAYRFVRAATDAGRDADRKTVAIAMGPCGRYLRPLAGKFGMPFLYAAIRSSRRTAAGQLTVGDLLDVHDVTRVGPQTGVYAVVGGDVSASLSPRAHNRAFRAMNRDSVYVDLSTGSFEDAAEVARELPLQGMSVTAPFKMDALEFADSADDDAAGMGVANTLVRNERGLFHASNTDAPGFLASLDLVAEDHDHGLDLALGRSLDSLLELDGAPMRLVDRRPVDSALVFGTGGVARAIAWALCSRGVRVFITGRSQQKTTAVALTLGGGIEAVSPSRAALLKLDLLVKAVPDRSWDDLPIDPFEFGGGGYAAEVVYSPLETNFLLAARRAGRVPIPGLMMFSEQAVLQASRFLSVDPAEVRPHVVQGIASGISLSTRRST